MARSASEAERLRALARRGYEALLEEERLETYRQWADESEMGVVSDALFQQAAEDGIFDD